MKKSKNKNSGRKKVPSFWWDFEGDNHVIVQSDNDDYPVVGRFWFEGSALVAINLAETMINGLTTGRLNVKECYENFCS